MGPPLKEKTSSRRQSRQSRRRRHTEDEEDLTSDDAPSSSSDESSVEDDMSSVVGRSENESDSDEDTSVGDGDNDNDNDTVTTGAEETVFTENEETARKDPLARLLASDHTLKEMEINHKHLKEWSSALSVQDIMVEVAKQSSLMSLIIDFEYVTMSKYDEIIESVAHSSSLIQLNIKNAKINRHTANAISLALTENMTLKQLTFHKCTFVGSGFPILFLGVQHVNELSHLSIEDCSLQGFTSEIIAATLPLIKTLTSLRLVRTQLPLDGLRFLCDNLDRCENLEDLDLSHNEFDLQSISWLVGCLQAKETKIKTLSLVQCSLDAACAEILCRGVAEDRSLQALNLKGNPIGNSGATSIFNLLKQNHQIVKISIKDCKIGRKASARIHNALRYNNSFLKNVFSADISLAILDSVSLMEKVPESFG